MSDEKVEVPVVEQKETVIPTKETAPVETPAVEESTFDLDLDEKVEPIVGEKVKFGKDKWKELDDDIDENDYEFDEPTSKLLNKVFDRAKDYKQKANEYKTVAEANKIINEDANIKYWHELRSSDDDKVVLAFEQSKYIKAGKGEDEALRLAQADVEELKTESERLFSKRAKDLRLELDGAINARSQELHSNISQTAKALSLSNAPDPNFLKQAVEELYKTDDFLGLKFGGKSETAKKDFLKPIEDAIKDGSLLKRVQSDPKLLRAVGLLDKYGDKFMKAIEKKSSNKALEKDKLAKAPHSSGMPQVKSDIVPTEGTGLKDPTKFR